MNDLDFHLSQINGHRPSENDCSIRELAKLWSYAKRLSNKSLVKDLISTGVIKDNSTRSIGEFLLRNSTSGSRLFRRNLEEERDESFLWAKIVEDKANKTCIEKSIARYDELSKDTLNELKVLSRDPENYSNVIDVLESVGIILIVEKALPKSKTDGVTGKTIDGRPYIGLSLRYPRIDHFWFTLFHELGHVSQHLENISEPILDSKDMEFDNDSKLESEADIFAQNNLIPRSIWRKAQNISTFKPSIKNLHLIADKAGVHPAIVAGRVRKETNNYTIFSDIVNRINIRDYFGY
ncbi:ImmA/IrrE family metallo-endopeptidase [Idiomarina loihiensis]|nr:ImmA/IrrE family metallo-endopeptidase [Idiomarina loihiensis]AGM37073.1 metal-dependent peptidase [Idiomarina loihiensis GSL 199]